MLLGVAIGLGFFTALYGRLWCGYACPQTVFLEEVIRRIEMWIEGDRGARRKLDKAPWTADKIRKKLLKYFLFMAVSFIVAITFVAYFTDTKALFTGQATGLSYAFVGAFTILMYADFAWFREQFCNYLCPYARIQGALTDIHSMVIGYNEKRGEPRLGKGVKKVAVLDRGGCVNCNRCVTVCPQGIDIRDGYQLECIACGHCVDACSEVMGKHGHPTLIKYTTEAELMGQPKKGFRLRPALYGVVLVGLMIAGTVMLLNKTSIDASVIRSSGTYFVELEDGRLQNNFEAHLFNNSDEPRVFDIVVEGLDDVQIVTPFPEIRIDARRDMLVPVFVLTADTLDMRATPIVFVFSSDGEEIRRDVTYMSGAPQ